MIKVIIADDHQMFIDGVSSFLNAEKNIQLVAETNSGKNIPNLIKQFHPDIVLLDVNMPDVNGIESSKIIKELFPEVKVIVLTMYNEKGFISSLLENGVDGYILKGANKNELVDAITSVYNGKEYYGKEVMKKMMTSLKNNNIHSEIELTKREIEIIELIVDEHTTDEIAEKLFISHHTVESHRKNILSKTGCKNTAGLVKFAFENGLVQNKQRRYM